MKYLFIVGSVLALLASLFLLRAPRELDVHNKSDRDFARVVALAPSYCETIIALGLVEKLVGVSEHCEASEAQNIAKVGSFAEANLEAILALKPDLVLAVPHVMAHNVLDALTRLGVAIFAHQPDSLADIKHINAEVARLLGVPDRGLALNSQLDQALELDGLVKTNKRTLIAVAHSPLVVAGSRTFASEVVNRLGLMNIAAKSSSPWPVWSLEELLSQPPELIIISEGKESLAGYQRLFQQIGLDVAALAIKLIVPEHPIFSCPSPRLTKDIEYLAKLLATNPS